MFYLKKKNVHFSSQMDVWKNKNKSLKTPWKWTSKLLEKGMSWSVGTMDIVISLKEEGFTPYGQSRDFYLGRVIYSQFTWFGVRRWGKRTPLISDCGRGVK